MQNFKKNLKLYILLAFFITNSLIWFAIFSEDRSNLIVAFLDIGQGDAIFIETPNGKQILIDGGPNAGVLGQLSKFMPFYDRSIDLVMMSHPDSDHIGGLPAVLNNYRVDYFMEPGVRSENGVYDELENLVSSKKINKILARQGMKIELCDNVGDSCDEYLEILFPNQDVSGFETNTASIVAKLVYEDESFLFTGDSPQVIEKYLVGEYGKDLRVNVLKLGHHGSSSSNSEVFLGFTDPEYAIASVGLNNRYGHPHKEVVGLLENLEIPLLRTDELGNIIFKTDGNNLVLEK